MGLNTYSIQRFIGINQGSDENGLSPTFSPDAANMDTTDGNLSVASGYTKYIQSMIPGSDTIDAIAVHKSSKGEMPIVITGKKVYVYKNGVWGQVYNYEDARTTIHYDTALVRINTVDYLLIADGAHQLIKFDGTRATPFGSEEGCSNIPVSYLTIYRGRLFAAGDPENPDRLYYSCLPGSGRTIEDWGYVESSPAVEGGHAEVGSTGGDPIVAIRALSNQLLIFKKNSLYRLIGDRPSNFTIERIDTSIRSTVHTAIAAYGDVLYFVTADGLYYYNGVTARPCPDMRMIKGILSESDVSGTRAVVVKDKLYFTLKRGGAKTDAIIEYDLIEHKYMLREGFNVNDITVLGENLLLVNNTHHVYLWGSGNTYDGQPINAYWYTPLTDLGDKAAIKSLHELYIRGSGDTLLIEADAGTVKTHYRAILPEDRSEVLEIPMLNEARCIRLKFANEAGGHFTLEGGVELCLGLRRRVD
ncbi:MAG: hypothetical protein J1E60_02170 [Christensenellaceae bacterium]|nr:hypothetical protein [Christensenellaceae bacterium]